MEKAQTVQIITDGWFCPIRKQTINWQWLDDMLEGESNTNRENAFITGLYEHVDTKQKYKITREQGIYYNQTFDKEGEPKDKYKVEEDDWRKLLLFGRIVLIKEVITANSDATKKRNTTRTHTVTKKVDKDQLGLF